MSDSIKTAHLKLLYTVIGGALLLGAAWGKLSYFPKEDGIILAENFKDMEKSVNKLTKENKAVNESVRELIFQMKLERWKKERMEKERRDRRTPRAPRPN